MISVLADVKSMARDSSWNPAEAHSMDRLRISGTRMCSSRTSTEKISTPGRIRRHPDGSSTSTTGQKTRAKAYPLPYQRALEQVRPERLKNNRKARRERWWQFAELAPAMRKAIAKLDEVLVIAIVSKSVMPLRVPTGQVFSHALAVFATNSFADQAVLSSSLHQMWAIKYSLTHAERRCATRLRTCSILSRGLSHPIDSTWLAGRSTPSAERSCFAADLGLTKLYNLVNDPDYADATHRSDATDPRRTRPGDHGRLWLGRRTARPRVPHLSADGAVDRVPGRTGEDPGSTA